MSACSDGAQSSSTTASPSAVTEAHSAVPVRARYDALLTGTHAAAASKSATTGGGVGKADGSADGGSDGVMEGR